MTTVAMSGNDTITINGTPITDLANADCVILTFPDDIATVKTGKNGNSIYGLNESGRQAEAKIKVMRASTDDIFLNNLLNAQRNAFDSFTLLTGTFIKKVGNGQGSVSSDTYSLSGGVFSKNVESKMNVEGDTDQSTSTYTIRFSNAPRAIT